MGTNNQNTDDGKQSATGTWLVITTSAGKFICRTDLSRDSILGAMDRQEMLRCQEAFDYACPMQTMPDESGRGVHLAKANFASRIDSTLFVAPMYFSTYGALVYFFDDMKQEDRQHYAKLVQDATAGAQASAKMRASRASGIVTATELPGGSLGRRS